MKTILRATVWIVAIATPVLLAAQDSAQRGAWNRLFEPFRLYGNIYYVGSKGLSAFLVTGPQGHVLIDGGLPETAPLIEANIRRLGFRLRDVKYLLIDHAHYDHAGGLAELKRATGARLVASASDAPSLEAGNTLDRRDIPGFAPVKVDRVVPDGYVLRLGGTALTARLTPGHTKGCTSWSLQTAGKNVLFACSLTVAGEKLVGNAAYPNVVADFQSTFARLRSMKADIFLTFHPDRFDMEEKRRRQRAGNANAFVDPSELPRQLAEAERRFNDDLAEQRVATRR